MKNKGALTKPLTLAVDWHDEMYYGDPKAEGVVGVMPKQGSCLAYRFATIGVLQNGERLTLAVVPMLDGCLFWHVKHFMDGVFELGLSIDLLLFDCGYFSTELINYLKDANIKFIMHMPWYRAPLKPGADVEYVTTSHKHRWLRRFLLGLLRWRIWVRCLCLLLILLLGLESFIGCLGSVGVLRLVIV
jgi:hypothetical protein